MNKLITCIRKISVLQNSPTAAGRPSDIILFRRNAFLPGGLFIIGLFNFPIIRKSNSRYISQHICYCFFISNFLVSFISLIDKLTRVYRTYCHITCNCLTVNSCRDCTLTRHTCCNNTSLCYRSNSRIAASP